MAKIEPLFTTECDSGIYSKAVGHPQYIPKVNEFISPLTLYDLNKYKELRNEIASSNVSEEIKKFLNFAATRHIIFNYERIADYYAMADKETQKLMEKSGLVIIDFDDAIENGFVELTETLKSLYEEKEAEKNA